MRYLACLIEYLVVPWLRSVRQSKTFWKKNMENPAIVVHVEASTKQCASTCVTLHISATPPLIQNGNYEQQRQRTIRAVFLDSFGASLGQRADHFSAAFSEGGPGERAEVTTHQLRRFFGLCGSPSGAKVSPRLWYRYSCKIRS